MPSKHPPNHPSFQPAVAVLFMAVVFTSGSFVASQPGQGLTKFLPFSQNAVAERVKAVFWFSILLALSFVIRNFLLGGGNTHEEKRPETKSKADGRLSELLVLTKEALDNISPFVFAVYELIGEQGEGTKLKEDRSFFSIADGCVETLLRDFFFKESNFLSIVGEEDDEVNIESRPYTVGGLVVPDALADKLDVAKAKVEALSKKIHSEQYQDVEIFIDPIDGTKEFCTGKGEQCTVIVGLSVGGVNRGGLVLRPLSSPIQFAMGCEKEQFFDANLNNAPDDHGESVSGFLTTNGNISPFLEKMMKEMSMTRVPAGGAGNKMLMLLERRAACYVLDRGLSRWDTCGSEAVAIAAGSHCSMLYPIVNNQPPNRYTYTSSKNNPNFIPNQSTLSRMNVRKTTNKDSIGELASSVDQVKPYSNMLGLFVIPPHSRHRTKQISDTVVRVAADCPPSFD